MRTWITGRTVTVLIASALIIVGYSGAAFAWVYAGHKWPTNNTLYAFNTTMPSTWTTPTYDAALTWNYSGANWSFYNDSNASNTWGAANYGSDNGALALTTVTYSGGTNESAWSDFNIYYPWSTSGDANSYDVQSAAAHEFGHWLSLDHSSDTTAVMYAYLSLGQIKRALAQDDINGIKYIYP